MKGTSAPNTMANGNGDTQQDQFPIDIEQKPLDDAHLMNNDVRTFVWRSVTVTVRDKASKQPKAILDNVDGIVEAGMISTPPCPMPVDLQI